MEKLINSSKFFHTLVKVMGRFFNIGAWICGVVAVLVWFLPMSAFENVEETLSFGPVTITRITDGVLAPEWVRLGVFEVVLLAFVGLVVGYLILRVLERILQPMSQGQPFSENVALDIKKLAWISLIGGFVLEVAKIVGIALTFGRQDLMVYFNPAMVSKVELKYTLNVWFIWLFALLMLMSYVFDYGRQLQQLSDETL